jgi:DNA-binding NarL/FixJ family response regulator
MNTAIKAFLLGMAIYPMMCSAQTSGCDAKRRSIENEITYAQAHGNAKRTDGLETALAQMNANCTDAVLRSDAQRKVTSAERKLSERQRDLQEAKADGKSAKKIADRQRKVDEAHAELERVLVEASQ